MSKKNIDDLRRERRVAAAAMVAASDALTALEDAEGAPDQSAMTAAQAEYDQAVVAHGAIDARVQRAEQVEAATIDAAGDAAAPPAHAGAPAQAIDPNDKGIVAGFAMAAMMAGKGDAERGARWLEAEGHSGVAAVLNTGTDTAGGYTIPRPQAAEVIELLRPGVTVRRFDVRNVPMPAGQLRHARQTGGATASYGAENALIPPSEPTFGAVDQAFKKLRGLIPISNSLMRYTAIGLAQFARDELVQVMTLREDLAFLRGDGTGDTPTGVVGWALPGSIKTEADKTAAAVDAQLRTAIAGVADATISLMGGGWVMRESTKHFLASLRTPGGEGLLYPTIETSNTLLGYRIETTSQVPNNLGVGGDESEIIFAAWPQVMIGDAMTLTIATSTEASYVDGATTRHAFQQDETLIRAISEHDLAPRHDAAIRVIRGKGWSI